MKFICCVPTHEKIDWNVLRHALYHYVVNLLQIFDALGLSDSINEIREISVYSIREICGKYITATSAAPPSQLLSLEFPARKFP
jgi:hypothetical protein